MNKKKYEEMTKEELCKEADEILKRFQISCKGDDSTIWVEDVCNLGKIVKTMKNCIVDEKEKVVLTLNNFFNRNKDYAIEIYTRNTATRSTIGYIVVPNERECIDKEKQYEVSWNNKYGKFKVPYDEVLNCYAETDEYGMQTVYVILKCGVTIEFECVGMVI